MIRRCKPVNTAFNELDHQFLDELNDIEIVDILLPDFLIIDIPLSHMVSENRSHHFYVISINTHHIFQISTQV